MLVKNKEGNYLIKNEEVLQNVILFLQIKHKMDNIKIHDAEFKKLMDDFKKLYSTIKHSLPKSFYFNYLFEQHCIDYPVIPVLEINQNIKEPSYIITLAKDQDLFLIWENKNEGRATYVFYTKTTDYAKSLQTLYDYIHADLKKKRSRIIDYIEQLKHIGNEIYFIDKISHSNFNTWETQLNKIMNNTILQYKPMITYRINTTEK